MLPQLLRLMFFDGTGMSLLFGDTDGRQEIEDFLALDL